MHTVLILLCLHVKLAKQGPSYERFERPFRKEPQVVYVEAGEKQVSMPCGHDDYAVSKDCCKRYVLWMRIDTSYPI